MSRPGARSLVVIRHGRTAWNAVGRFQGHADVPLDADGERQADDMAASVATLRPDLVLCSDLRRARATAAPLVAATGARLCIDPALREIDVGGWQGLDHAEVAAAFPEEFRDWQAGRPVRRGGGETEAEAGTRAAGFIAGHLAALATGAALAAGAGLAAGAVAVVAHGVVLRAALTELSAAGVIALPGPAPHLDNGAWTTFEVLCH